VHDSGVEELAGSALEWLASEARPVPDGVAWAGATDQDEFDPTLYSGGAGVVMALLEAYRHLGDERWADLAVRAGGPLVAQARGWGNASLYMGTTGIAWALHSLGTTVGTEPERAAARDLLASVRRAFDGERWGAAFDLIGGNAGIGLGALAMGDVELAETAVEPYLRRAETTPCGVTWENRRGMRPRRHHISHGTLGIAHALASVGAASGRADLTELALAGVADVVARDEAGPTGFLVPYSDPQQDPDRIERYSYGWCHGPAGDAQVFRLLHQLTGDESWLQLQHRCWSTVLGSGLPERRRPGFWDNNGRCCGTAGVLALAGDRIAELGDGRDFGDILVADLAHRAVVDEEGARWSNLEHRAERADLPPRHGWAMGNAGIVRELLRYARITAGGDPSYAVTWPDQPPVVSPGAAAAGEA
jgi:hypothetical protein